MMTTVFYIPGFDSASSGKSSTADALALLLGEDFNVKCLQYNPLEPVSALRQIGMEVLPAIVNATEDSIIVGSSLGGFFAHCLSLLYDLPVVLINPSAFPSKNLSKYGVAHNAKDYEMLEQSFVFGIREDAYGEVPRIVIVGTNDNVINPNENGLVLADGAFVKEIDMGHRPMFDTDFFEIANEIKFITNQVYGEVN